MSEVIHTYRVFVLVQTPLVFTPEDAASHVHIALVFGLEKAGISNGFVRTGAIPDEVEVIESQGSRYRV